MDPAHCLTFQSHLPQSFPSGSHSPLFLSGDGPHSVFLYLETQVPGTEGTFTPLWPDKAAQLSHEESVGFGITRAPVVQDLQEDQAALVHVCPGRACPAVCVLSLIVQSLRVWGQRFGLGHRSVTFWTFKFLLIYEIRRKLHTVHRQRHTQRHKHRHVKTYTHTHTHIHTHR